ncbi:MAG: hypothetical protein P1V35_10065, partial [Planctomycetota bacterium]|nr:hypothetical protein [Planctomycetota bacterium]
MALVALLSVDAAHASTQSDATDKQVTQTVAPLTSGPTLAHDVLLLGDSITVGHTAEPGFRDDLHTLLSGVAGHSYTFLGSSGTAPLNGHFLGGR